MLQPRRVAARATAARIADEQNWSLGDEVGYQVRFERRISAATRLRIQTEGILNRQLLADPFLESIGAVVLDEFHERSIHSDLAMALLREVRREVRPDLIIVVMSATLDAEPVARFLGDCPVVRGRGAKLSRSTSNHRAASVRPAPRRSPRWSGRFSRIGPRPGPRPRLPARDGRDPPGPEGDRAAGRGSGGRRAALARLAAGRRPGPGAASRSAAKIILATNIAETSLTIDGVTTVIDSGLARIAHHDPQRGFDRLDLGRISQASATQRAGRAGRTGPGAVHPALVRARAADAGPVRDCRGPPRRPLRRRAGAPFLGCPGRR